MQIRYFKFPDMETSFSAAAAEGLTSNDDAGNPILIRSSHDYEIDVIGVIYEPTGNMLTGPDGDSYPEMASVPGWHVNALLLNNRPLPTSLEQYEVFPVNPTRSFLCQI